MTAPTEPLLTLLRVGTVHTPGTVDTTEILIADGRIAALGKNLTVPADWPVAEALLAASGRTATRSRPAPCGRMASTPTCIRAPIACRPPR